MIRFPGSETSFRNQGFHGSGSVWEQDALLVPVYLVAVATATINTGSLQQEGTITWSMERYRRVFVFLHDGWFDYVFCISRWYTQVISFLLLLLLLLLLACGAMKTVIIAVAPLQESLTISRGMTSKI